MDILHPFSAISVADKMALVARDKKDGSICTRKNIVLVDKKALVVHLVVLKKILCLRSSIHSYTSGGVESALLMQCVVAHRRAQMLLYAFGASDEWSGHFLLHFEDRI